MFCGGSLSRHKGMKKPLQIHLPDTAKIPVSEIGEGRREEAGTIIGLATPASSFVQITLCGLWFLVTLRPLDHRLLPRNHPSLTRSQHARKFRKGYPSGKLFLAGHG